jgi:MYXO-CTERM domain-containing protein
LQPAEDHTPGLGKLSFGTNPGRTSSPARGDVDLGRTTLQSPVFALRGMRDPTLAFYVWHVAKNFTRIPPETLASGALVIRGTDDDGETWTEMGRFEENTDEWTRVTLRIRDHLELTNKVRFRFEIEEEPISGVDPLIEAGIDDVEIIDYLPSCMIDGEVPDAGVPDGSSGGGGRREEDGCGCASTATPRSILPALALLLGLVFIRRRGR